MISVIIIGGLTFYLPLILCAIPRFQILSTLEPISLSVSITTTINTIINVPCSATINYTLDYINTKDGIRSVSMIASNGVDLGSPWYNVDTICARSHSYSPLTMHAHSDEEITDWKVCIVLIFIFGGLGGIFIVLPPWFVLILLYECLCDCILFARYDTSYLVTRAWNGTSNIVKRAWNGTSNLAKRAWNGTSNLATRTWNSVCSLFKKCRAPRAQAHPPSVESSVEPSNTCGDPMKQLVAMGFEPRQVAEALRVSNGGVDQALRVLLDNADNPPPAYCTVNNPCIV